MEHSSDAEVVLGGVGLYRARYAVWLIEHQRITDALPGETLNVILVPAVAPEPAGFAWGLWRHSRE